jgi:hypothetical protein
MAHEVDAIAGAVVDPKFRDAVANRLGIARVTQCEAAYSGVWRTSNM